VFTDYPDDTAGERILKSGRAGFVGWLGFGGSVMQWRPDLAIGFGYACTLLTWWDLANCKATGPLYRPRNKPFVMLSFYIYLY
jgi:hypothetical protein